MTPRRLLLAAAAVATLLIAGCGGSSSSPLAAQDAAVAASDRGMIDFTHCMRARGIEMADPYHRPGHTGLSISLPPAGPAVTNATKSCGHFLAGLIAEKMAHAQAAITPSIRLALVHYAECMREHAISMLDPNQFGALNLGNVPGISNGFGRYTPQFAAADHVCRRLLPPGVRDNGSGP